MTRFPSESRYPAGMKVSGNDFDAKWVDPNKRASKNEHPYDYDEFFLFGDRRVVTTADRAFYSDKLERQGDPDEVIKTPAKNPEELSVYLSKMLATPVECIACAEGCRKDNAFPYWIYWVKLV